MVDYEGDNPSYPERVRLKIKDFFQEFDEAAVTNQCRKLAATLEAPEEALQLPVSVSAKAKAAAKDGQGPGKGSGPEHSEVAGANTAAFAVERLKAFEQWAHQFEVVLLMPFRKNYDTLNAQAWSPGLLHARRSCLKCLKSESVCGIVGLDSQGIVQSC